MLYTLLRIVHLLAALTLAMAIVIPALAAGTRLGQEERQGLRRMLAVQGAAAGVTGIAGALLWLGTGRPAVFFSDNPLFHAKLGLFALLVLLALPLLRALYGSTAARLPRAVIFCIRLQTLVLLAIPVLAWMMARGIGH